MPVREITILLADDHTVVRQGLARLLEAESGFKVIGQAENGREAVSMVAEYNPDIILMDISMPLLNGIEAARQIKKMAPEAKIIILSMHSHDRYISELFCTGISGYLLKSASSKDIINAIHEVVKGGTYISPSISKRLIEEYVCMKKNVSGQDRYAKLSNREREIFQLVSEGRTNSEISDILCISPSTVKTHRTHIMEKLDLKNVFQLVQYAIHIGVVDVDSYSSG